MPGELVLTTHDHPDAGGVRVSDLLDISRERLAVVSIQLRLGIEEIHLARPAIHEKLNDRFCLGRVMSLLRLQVKRLMRCLRPEKVIAQQRCQCRTEDAIAGAGEKISATGQPVVRTFHLLQSR